MDVYDLSRAFLACYFLFVALHYTARLTGLRARHNHSFARPGEPGTVNWRHQMTFRGFRLAILLACLARVPFPETVDALAVTVSAPPAVILVGMALMCVAFYRIDYVHSYMDTDWRSGTGPDRSDKLLEDGPFGSSRNPIFFAVVLGQIGFLMAWPSLFAALCLAVGALVILRRSVDEERVLSARFGDRYGDYRMRVPRWLGLPRDRGQAG